MLPIAVKDWIMPAITPQEAESSSDEVVFTRRRQNRVMALGACPGQISTSWVPPSLSTERQQWKLAVTYYNVFQVIRMLLVYRIFHMWFKQQLSS